MESERPASAQRDDFDNVTTVDLSLTRRKTRHLHSLGLERKIIAIVDGFATALALARASDLIATVPERHTGGLRAGMHSFSLPIPAPEVTVSLLWHPRLDSDPAHRWLRGHVRDVCAAIS